MKKENGYSILRKMHAPVGPGGEARLCRRPANGASCAYGPRAAKGGAGMFGYVTPCRAECRVREWEEYRAAYCGLCKTLARRCGHAARMALNYDMVLLALLADGLAGESGSVCQKRCAASCLRTHPECAETPGLALAADALALTAWYHLADDAADEPFGKALTARAGRFLLRGAHRKAAAARPELEAVFAAEMAAQAALEAAGERAPDAAAEPTARMTAALFCAAAAQPEQRRALTRFGQLLGRVLYWLDAAEDYEKDAARGAYNVFLRAGLTKEQTVEEAQRRCRMCACEMSLAWNVLECGAHKGLLENILFLGVPGAVAHAGRPRAKQARHARA